MFFGIAALLFAETILIKTHNFSETWTYLVIIISAIALIGLLLHWVWRLPHVFWCSPIRHRATVFTQPGLIWRNIIIFFVSGSTLPLVELFTNVGFNQVLGSLMLGAFFYFALYIHLWNDENQRERDLRAYKIFCLLKEGIIHKYCLYLRPFESTGRMTTLRNEREFKRSREFIDVEAVISEAVEPRMPLIGLGKPGEQVGAGRISSTDENWWSSVKLLIDNAVLIFVLPQQKKGATRKEVEWLLTNRYVDKCIFLMPPNWENNWKSVSIEMESLGIKFPKYRSEGLLFTLAQDEDYLKTITGAIQLDMLLDNSKELLKALDMLVRGTAETEMPEPYLKGPEQDTEMSDRWFWFRHRALVYMTGIAWFSGMIYLWML